MIQGFFPNLLGGYIEIIKVLTILGFEKVSQKGSHAKYKKAGKPSKIVIIPMHDEVARGTLKSITFMISSFKTNPFFRKRFIT